MIAGLLIYKTRMPLVVTTVVGLACLGGLIVLGYHLPFELPGTSPEKWWVIILLIYAMGASVLPVSILLQPRDHLSAGVLFIGMVLGFGGIAITRPVIQSPPVVSLNSDIGTIWPMLFVTVACGAISGFHCLISSGTTSKQLPRIKDARPIGYGAMIAESALALLAIIAVTAGLYWKEAPENAGHLVYQTIMRQDGGGPIAAFGRGYGELARPLLGSLGAMVGIIVLKTFIMTTLDSATRITRYIASELFGDTLGIRPLRNRYVSTIVVGLLAGALALSNWNAIWPIFGSANQLIAALVLIVATGYLVARGRKWIFVAIPAIFVTPTALGALIYKLHSFLTAEDPNYMLAILSTLLIALGLFISARGIEAIVRYRKEQAT
jgi:carbon starvation protein